MAAEHDVQRWRGGGGGRALQTYAVRGGHMRVLQSSSMTHVLILVVDRHALAIRLGVAARNVHFAAFATRFGRGVPHALARIGGRHLDIIAGRGVDAVPQLSPVALLALLIRSVPYAKELVGYRVVEGIVPSTRKLVTHLLVRTDKKVGCSVNSSLRRAHLLSDLFKRTSGVSASSLGQPAEALCTRAKARARRSMLDRGFSALAVLCFSCLLYGSMMVELSNQSTCK